MKKLIFALFVFLSFSIGVYIGLDKVDSVVSENKLTGPITQFGYTDNINYKSGTLVEASIGDQNLQSKRIEYQNIEKQIIKKPEKIEYDRIEELPLQKVSLNVTYKIDSEKIVFAGFY